MGIGFLTELYKKCINNNNDGTVDYELSKDTEGWKLSNKGKPGW